MGVPIAAVVVLAWIVIFAVLIRGAGHPRRRGLIVPVAGLSVAILAVLHSLIDFSVQIPGYSYRSPITDRGGAGDSVKLETG